VATIAAKEPDPVVAELATDAPALARTEAVAAMDAAVEAMS
jgi:hypothetical protein